MKHIPTFESFVNEAGRLSDVKIKKGKMHKMLGLSPDEEITDKYKSGKELAQDLVRAAGGDQQEVAGMLAYAANINPASNVFDDALSALKEI